MSPEIAWTERGDGPKTLVFLHGIGGGKALWQRQVEHFAGRGWRSIAWDAPGYGESPPLAAPGWAALADALAGLLDRLRVARAVVVGHSMGGMLAQEFAAEHPGRLQALVLSATSPAFGKADGEWQREFIGRRLGPLDEGRSMADLAPALVAGMVGPGADPAGVAAAVASMGKVPPETYRQSMHVLVGFDRREALSRIAVPCLLLAGENDTNAPPMVMRRMADRIAGARYVCLPGAGHLANLEQPAAFDAALQDFLDGLEH